MNVTEQILFINIFVFISALRFAKLSIIKGRYIASSTIILKLNEKV